MDAVITAAYAAAVVGLVQIAKQMGMPTKFAALSAAVAGVILLGARQLVGAPIDTLVLGLAATGVYTLVGELRG